MGRKFFKCGCVWRDSLAGKWIAMFRPHKKERFFVTVDTEEEAAYALAVMKAEYIVQELSPYQQQLLDNLLFHYGA